MHAEQLPCTVSLPKLVLIAQATFLLERGHMHRHTDTDAIDHPTHSSSNTGMGC